MGFAEDHEVLTILGWQPLATLQPTDRIATRASQWAEHIEFIPAGGVLAFAIAEDVYDVQAPHCVDQRLTFEHSVPSEHVMDPLAPLRYVLKKNITRMPVAGRAFLKDGNVRLTRHEITPLEQTLYYTIPDLMHDLSLNGLVLRKEINQAVETNVAFFRTMFLSQAPHMFMTLVLLQKRPADVARDAVPWLQAAAALFGYRVTVLPSIVNYGPWVKIQLIDVHVEVVTVAFTAVSFVGTVYAFDLPAGTLLCVRRHGCISWATAH